MKALQSDATISKNSGILYLLNQGSFQSFWKVYEEVAVASLNQIYPETNGKRALKNDLVTQEQVDAVTALLKSSRENLISTKNVNAGALKLRVDQYKEQYDEKMQSVDSWVAFGKALARQGSLRFAL